MPSDSSLAISVVFPAPPPLHACDTQLTEGMIVSEQSSVPSLSEGLSRGTTPCSETCSHRTQANQSTPKSLLCISGVWRILSYFLNAAKLSLNCGRTQRSSHTRVVTISRAMAPLSGATGTGSRKRSSPVSKIRGKVNLNCNS